MDPQRPDTVASLLGVDGQKRAAAARAVEEIVDGMVVGLGSGSTAAFAVECLAERIGQGLRIVAIPTSKATAVLAQRLGVPLSNFHEHRRIDITIDGADQVARANFDLIKGLGGALLHEKIVASASDRMIVIVDETKLVERLGAQTPLPVEVVPFGWQTAFDHFAAMDFNPQLRRRADDQAYVTDSGNFIIDCFLAEIPDAVALEACFAGIVGVVESGLFIDMASTIVIGRPQGIDVIER